MGSSSRDIGVAGLVALMGAMGSTGCGEGAPFVRGLISVVPCSPGPDAAACEAAAVPPACAERLGLLSPELPQPHVGASVFLADTQAVTVSDGDGLFEIGGVTPGPHVLAVVAPWTDELRQTRLIEVDAAPLDDDHVDGRIEMTFTAAGRLKGRVVAPSEPPPGDTPELFGGIDGVEIQLACPPRSATTDAQGGFVLEGVPQGLRQLTALGIGLTGISEPLWVQRGRTTTVTLAMHYGRPPEPDENRPPIIASGITLTPLPDGDTGITVIRPPGEVIARGQRIALHCEATDPDGDTLRYIWNASNGELQAGNAPDALFTAGDESVGVSCTVLDGRGGIAAVDRLVEVADPTFAGAALTGDGVLFSAAFGADFDLVRWRPGGAQRLTAAGQQWLPVAGPGWGAFRTREAGSEVLWAAPLTALDLSPLSGTALGSSVRGAAVTTGGVVWVDAGGRAQVTTLGASTPRLIGPGFSGELAVAGSRVAIARADASEAIALFDITAGGFASLGLIPAPGRLGGPIAIDGQGRLAYWDGAGAPMLQAAGGVRALGNERAPEGRTGRVLLNGSQAAYSLFDSPLTFIEATVVQLDGPQAGARLRVAVGPAEVLDMDPQRLLLGRPRASESEPSADLWILDLTTLVLETTP